MPPLDGGYIKDVGAVVETAMHLNTAPMTVVKASPRTALQPAIVIAPERTRLIRTLRFRIRRFRRVRSERDGAVIRLVLRLPVGQV